LKKIDAELNEFKGLKLTPKIKAFRANLRGVRDITFFLFRVAKIYA